MKPAFSPNDSYDLHAVLDVFASSTSNYSYYACKLAGLVIGNPVNSSSLVAAARSCNYQFGACRTEYENYGEGCTAELKGIQ